MKEESARAIPQVIPGPDDPYRVAEAYAEYSEKGLGRLINWQDEFYRYSGGCYRKLILKDLRTELYRWLSVRVYAKGVPGGTKELQWQPNQKTVSHVVDALSAVVSIVAETQPRSWIGPEQEVGFNGSLHIVIPTTCGILHVGTNGQESWQPCSSDFFCLSAVPLDVAPTGYFSKYCEMIGMDQSDRKYYAELNGSAMANWWPEQVAHLKVGAPRTGKGTLKDLTMKLVGSGAVSISMQALSEHLERSPLIGATYVSVPEHRESSSVLKSSMAFFLRATGGDRLDIGRKNKQPWNGTIHALWDFDANAPSVFRDPSGASASRFVGMHFTKSFRGNEDTAITGLLRNDLRSVFDDAVAGLHRLIAQGKFTRTDRWKTIEDELWSSTSIEMTFLEDYTEFGDDLVCPLTYLWQAWREFCSEGGYHAGGRDAAVARIRSAADTLGFRISLGRLSAAEAEERRLEHRVRVVRGIKLKKPSPVSVRKFVPGDKPSEN